VGFYLSLEFFESLLQQLRVFRLVSEFLSKLFYLSVLLSEQSLISGIGLKHFLKVLLKLFFFFLCEGLRYFGIVDFFVHFCDIFFLSFFQESDVGFLNINSFLLLIKLSLHFLKI
jgi:hypothetical protein